MAELRHMRWYDFLMGMAGFAILGWKFGWWAALAAAFIFQAISNQIREKGSGDK